MMLNYFPRYCSVRAIYCYLITLALTGIIFSKYILPFQYMLFGIVPVVVFFTFSNRLTMNWQRSTSLTFSKMLFVTALVLRILYVIFIYFYYIEMTGEPFAYHKGDEGLYHDMGALWRTYGYRTFVEQLNEYIDFSDSGYCWWVAIVYLITGVDVLPLHILKCIIDAFSCVLIYNLARRNFGEEVGRMAAIFYLLMPNMWYYCGVTLKETEMVFLLILFVERSDAVLRSSKIKFAGIILPVICILLMFTFRTALGAVMVASFVAGLIFTTSKQLQDWKKIVYGSVFAIWMIATVGVEMIQETKDMWAERTENQATGYEWRAETNSFAKYATSVVFAPMIFTIPFSSMVVTPDQENQMMMNGANFIKNIISGFTVFAIISLLLSGEWRKHIVLMATTLGYLLVLAFSNFAHSERFHFPVLAFELVLAAYGVSLMKNKQKRWYMFWIIGICIANIAWSWIKLAGRDLI